MTAAELDGLVTVFRSTRDLTDERSAVLAVANKVLDSLLAPSVHDEIPAVIDAVAKAFSVRDDEIRSRSRVTRVTVPRHVVWWVLHRRKHGWSDVGRAFGVHHSSVMSACDRIRERLVDDEVFRGRVRAVEEAIQARREAA